MTTGQPYLQTARIQADLSNPDRATAETIQVMCNLIKRSAGYVVVQRAAQDALKYGGGPLFWAGAVSPEHPIAKASSAWERIHRALTFVLHDKLIDAWFGEQDQLQLLISPELLVWMQKPKGDCAIYAMMVCAFLRCYEIPYELVTAAVTPADPVYDHVWCRAVRPDGQRFNLDASHGKYPGWQVPLEHRMRTQVWDADGSPIDDAAQFRGLHGYQARPATPILPARLRLGLGGYRGLGDDGASAASIVVDPVTGNQYDATGTLIAVGPNPYPTLPSVPPPSFPTPSGASGGTNWSSVLGNLVNAWTQIGGRVIAPTTTVATGPGGTMIQTPAGSSIPATAALSTFGAFGSTSLMPLLLLGIGAVVVFSLVKKK